MSLILQGMALAALGGLPRKFMVVGYFAETKGLVGSDYRPRLALKMRDLQRSKIELREYPMTHNPQNGAVDEIVLPENLLPLGSVLGEGVTPLEVSKVLAKVFHVQHGEVALLKLEGGLLKFIFPEYLRTTGAIPISSKAVAAHTAISKKAEIFNNFARVKHA